MRTQRCAALLLLLPLALTGCGDKEGNPAAQIGPNPPLPALQQYLLPPLRIAPVVGWGQGKMPSVAAGLRIQRFAGELQHPRSIYTLPNGDVLVVESKGPGTEPTHRPKQLIMHWVMGYATGGGGEKSNRITLLRDADGDGIPEFRSVFLDNLNSPFGVALVGNDLYVANTDAVVRYPYTTGDTKITAAGTVLTPLPGSDINHHWTKSLLASRDGSLLYVGIGSNSNITENGMMAERERANILEVERATGRYRVYASGLRNPNGLSWEPSTGALWVVVNERDEIGPDLVPDYLTSVKENGFYGWPYSYYGQNVDPRVHPQRPDLVAKALVPDYSLSSHVAPLGLAFNVGSGLPEKYRGGAFIGEHGSWGRVDLNGYKVVFVPFAEGRPSGPAEDIVTGFLDTSNNAQGRPVGVAFDRAGGLLIADDVGDVVWRITSDRQ